MAINEKNFDKNIQNAVNAALNGDDSSPFFGVANTALAEARKNIEQANHTKSLTDSKYIPMTPAAMENAARERAAEMAKGRIAEDLRTAKVAGDDKSNMIGFVLGMAFGGGGSMLDMITKVFKGDSPFFQTVNEFFFGNKDSDKNKMNFTDRWKENVQLSAIDVYAKANGLSKDGLIAALSKTSDGDVQLAKILETEPSKAGGQKENDINERIKMARQLAVDKARLEFEANEAAAEEMRRLKKEKKVAANNGVIGGTETELPNGKQSDLPPTVSRQAATHQGRGTST